MSMPTKAVVVIAEELPVGVALNTAALLGISLGNRASGLVGEDGPDASGHRHLGMSTHPVPVLKASAERLKELYADAAALDGVLVADMSEVAQKSRTYDAYLATLGGTKPEDMRYLGVMLHGPRPAVDSLTGQLPLYR